MKPTSEVKRHILASGKLYHIKKSFLFMYIWLVIATLDRFGEQEYF